MYPSQHLILGIAFATILFNIFPQITLIGFFLIVLSAFFIDVDHYLFYVYKNKNISLKNAYKWFIKKEKKYKKLSIKERKKYKNDIFIFHGIEFWIFLAILSFIHNYFFFIFIGIMFHMFLDFAFPNIGEFSHNKISQIYNLRINKKKREFIIHKE
jgi:hypothetical protein|tara:strand:- start:2439 stop:2906 length:468 start_codon:yes stop_codon:yes gene_type:complete